MSCHIFAAHCLDIDLDDIRNVHEFLTIPRRQSHQERCGIPVRRVVEAISKPRHLRPHFPRLLEPRDQPEGWEYYPPEVPRQVHVAG